MKMFSIVVSTSDFPDAPRTVICAAETIAESAGKVTQKVKIRAHSCWLSEPNGPIVKAPGEPNWFDFGCELNGDKADDIGRRYLYLAWLNPKLPGNWSAVSAS